MRHTDEKEKMQKDPGQCHERGEGNEVPGRSARVASWKGGGLVKQPAA
eukprot:COSAG02_NODE_5618_length_4179_cov_6.208333_6_plen_48_part_00